MSVTITVDRTESGGFRAVLPDSSSNPASSPGRLEAETLEEVIRELEAVLEGHFGEVERRARHEIAKKSVRSETLKELLRQYPAPPDWFDEPDWSDAP